MENNKSTASYCEAADIDDFLMNYKHHPGSINEFISGLDAPLLVPTSFDLPFATLDWSISSHEAVLKIEAESLDPTSQRNENQRPSLVKTPCVDSDTMKVTAKKSAKKYYGTRTRFTPEEREERRRYQNREAQRRYREKRVLDVYRKMSERLYVSNLLF